MIQYLPLRTSWIALAVSVACGCTSQPQSPEPIRSAPSGTAAPPTALADNSDAREDDLQQLELASLLGSGAISAEHNAGWNNFPRKLTDGDTGTFKTTGGVDPAVLTFTFQQPTTVKSVRLFVSGATQYDWTVKAGSGGEAFGIRGAGPEQWSRIDLPEPLTTQSLVLELTRPGPDHTFSLHEIEVYGPGS